MYCSNCGTNISDDVKFCPECGEPRQPKAVDAAKEPMGSPASSSEDATPAAANVSPEVPPAPQGAPVVKATYSQGVAASNAASAPASAAKQGPWYGKPWVIIVIVVAVIVAVAVSVIALGTSMDASNRKQLPAASQSTNTPVSSSASSSASSEASAAAGAQSNASSASSDRSSSSWADLANSNYTTRLLIGTTPSVSYLASHDGEDIIDYIIGLGYDWSSSDKSFVLEHDGEHVTISGLGLDGKPVSEDDFEDFDQLYFTGNPVAYQVVVSPGTLDDVVKAMLEGSDTDASAKAADGETAMFLTWPGGADDIIVYVTRESSTGTTTLNMYNEAYLAAGKLPAGIGEGKPGMTASKFFDQFAQKVQTQGWIVAG